MCKFHKDVAREIATDPVHGTFDPARYAVALVAMAQFRIEQYMPSMFGTDGYSKYALASDRGVAAFAGSGLAGREKNYPPGMDELRRALPQGLSLKALNLPKNPVRDVGFLDEATVELFENYTAPGYAAGELRIRDRAHKPEFEPIRAAAADFLEQPGVTDALRAHFEYSLARIFTEAREEASPALLKLYNKMPDGLRSVFKSCASCVGPGAGGALLSHVGCIAVPVIAGATGTAVSGGVMAGMMLVGSPLIAAGVGYGIDRWRGQKTSILRLSGAAAIAFGVALGIGAVGDGHDHHGHAPDQHEHHEHQHHQSEGMDWLNRQTPENRQMIIDAAAQSGLGLQSYLETLCRPKSSPAPSH